MRTAPHLFNEDARLSALAEYDLLNAEDGVDLAEIIGLTSRLFDAPIVLVSIVERSRQVFKAGIGLDLCETDCDISFCTHTLQVDTILIVPDATLDPRFFANPMVTGAPGIRFYAGVPLRSPQGHAIGTLCIIDRLARNGLSPREQHDLIALAGFVLDKMEMRRLAAAGAIGQSRFENIAATSPDGIICSDGDGRITFWNVAAERLFGFTAQQAVGSAIDIIVPERARGGHDGGLHRVAGGGKPRLVGTTVELEAAHRDGTEFPIELSLSMWRGTTSVSFGAIIRNIGERRANEERLFNLAHLDGLTGLPNRTVLMTRIADCTRMAEPVAVMMIDLDGFKDVNDTLGHTAGDSVLRQVAARILACARPIDTVARLGGDEFAVLMPRRSREDVERAADCVIQSVATPILVDGQLIHVSASVGIALFPHDGAHAEDLLSAADLAMYQAKAEGRDCRRFFEPRLREIVLNRRAFESEIRRAVEKDEFELFYQPQIRTTDGALLGVEALLRWRHPVEGILTPERFLSSIESGLLASEVGRWAIETACTDAITLRRSQPDLMMCVNLFGAQFRSGRLAAEVIHSLARSGLPAEALELEITENIILRHDETMMKPLRDLRALGVGIAFDDFGTGFASLSLLKRYPLSRIKIDRSFIRDICESDTDAAIVNAMVYLASVLKVEVIAEGVETEQQREFLLACGCTVVQGYLYGAPMSLADLHVYMGKRAADDRRQNGTISS